MMSRVTSLVTIFACTWIAAWPCPAADAPVDFDRDIRPIFSDKCFACHGPNEADREGGFRLDVQESVLGEADSGEHPIVPGDPDSSEVVARLTADDEDLRMPPSDSNKTVTADEIEQIRRWIEQGAPWRQHWSLIPPRRPELPAVNGSNWPQTPVDRFILARLQAAGLAPLSKADRATLIRRVTFDLTGLPPTLAEVDAFLADRSPRAYEKVVDRLLQSPAYGEHMARFWLDAARYGDTHGLHLDNYREMWLYRDWVIRAFNDNMPFDQFTVEQLAGDLLPEPTLDQLIATGFDRCNVTTNEGGSIKEEVYVRNVVDRVVTTGSVFMGLTLDCTRCHDHKYDPLTMKDFYSMFAFFNSMDGDAMDGNRKDPPPVARVPTPEQKQQIASLRQQIEQTREQIASQLGEMTYVEPAEPAAPQPVEPKEVVWIEDQIPAGANAVGGWKFVEKPKPVYSGKKAHTRTATGLSQHFFTGAKQPLRVAEGDVLMTYVYLDPDNRPKEIMLQWNDGSWEHRAYWGANKIEWGADGSASRRHMGDLPAAGQWVRLEVPAAKVGLKADSQINGWAFAQFDGTVYWDKAGIVTRARQQRTYDSLLAWQRDQRAQKKSALPKEIQALVARSDDQRSLAQQKQLRQYFLEHIYSKTRAIFGPMHEKIEQATKQIATIEKSVPTTLIFRERKKPRPSFILNRGEYDQQREPVGRATPASLPPMPDDAPRNRLGLARWLISPAHPLMARVTVNRFWQQVFGTGIVKTAEDFGSQGEPPSHPKLLDWLAVQLIEDGWDVKRTMKRLVMSATYQQRSNISPQLESLDPENRLLARGPRFRLDAEMLRDQALAVSGLLCRKMGGPSVKPPQPDGLWFAVGYSGSNTVRFKADQGDDKIHRRSVYTFIKRTSPPPQMSTLDAPSRESCRVRRERTNTPLQALLMMNDQQFVEPARALAQRTLREGGATAAMRATYMFQLATARPPSPAERKEMLAAFDDHLATYRADPAAAGKLAAVSESAPDKALDKSELAAWTMLANLILNLDEVVTKN